MRQRCSELGGGVGQRLECRNSRELTGARLYTGMHTDWVPVCSDTAVKILPETGSSIKERDLIDSTVLHGWGSLRKLKIILKRKGEARHHLLHKEAGWRMNTEGTTKYL